MAETKITIKNLQKKIRFNPKKVKTAVLKALSIGSLKAPSEITICFVSDKKIKELNARFRKINLTTDVLAFELGPDADIVVSADTAKRNSRIFNTSLLYELTLYAVHGALHLVGYDDKTLIQRKRMQKKAENILARSNLCPSTAQKPLS